MTKKASSKRYRSVYKLRQNLHIGTQSIESWALNLLKNQCNERFLRMLVSQTSSRLRFVSSTFLIFQILVHSHFALVNSLLALDAPEPVSQPVIQMAINMITILLVWVRQKQKSIKTTFFFITQKKYIH